MIATVTCAYVDDSMLKDGMFDTKNAQILARLGYQDYTMIDRVFPLQRPE